MARKSEIKKQIEDTEREIEALEGKLMRSQIAVLGAIMEDKEPSSVDKEYFKVYSKLIDVERDNLKELYKQLDEVQNAKKKKQDEEGGDK